MTEPTNLIIYRSEEEEIALTNEPEYVKERYQVIIRLLVPPPLYITRNEAAKILKISKRQVYRLQKQFNEQGIAGLRLKSKKPC